MKRREFGQVVVAGGLAALVPSLAILESNPAKNRVKHLKIVFAHQIAAGETWHEPLPDFLLSFVERCFPAGEKCFAMKSFLLSEIKSCGWEVDFNNHDWSGPTLESPFKSRTFLPLLKLMPGSPDPYKGIVTSAFRPKLAGNFVLGTCCV